MTEPGPARADQPGVEEPGSAPVAGRGLTEREARIWAALREVLDPEIPISLVDLGLICAVREAGSCIEVDITFTATACPCMGFIREDIRTRLLQEADVDDVEIHEVWDPPWTVERVSPEGREALRRFGVAT